MLRSLSLVLVMFFGMVAQAQSYHVKYGSQTLICNGDGKVGGVAKLFLQETTKANQLCGYFENATGEIKTVDCFEGDLNSEVVLEREEVAYGENILTLRNDAKLGYVLSKAFVCDWNHEEKCMPGIEVVLAESTLNCSISTLKY